MNRTSIQICQRMSLRKPQIEALQAFMRAVGALKMDKTVPVEESLEALKKEFPSLKSFERNFPNLAFSLATGVGKTRLMGAMIYYLIKHYDVRDFVILTPNNTILEKLVREFSTPSDPKYIFRGIAEFANNPPRIITGDNFDEGHGVRSDWSGQLDFFSGDEICINIFNIAMINSEKRKIKNPRETIINGLSPFEYLAQQEKLVVFMDEAHRYRAEQSSKAIEELRPILGVELTATAQVEKNNGKVPFLNILYDYNLKSAIDDQYVKEPVVVGRENFQASQFTDESLEILKLEDGVRIHESTKIHLQNYAFETGELQVKPFILVISESMAHANRLEAIVKSSDFFEGHYKDKVRVVHSGRDPDEEERMVKDLLEIESLRNPIEIVVHVNMLREGWDVVNLYTIIPLRAANSSTLIEQSIGRGLRLPYGKRTGIKEVDELNIVFHDRFDELVKEAGKPNSIIKRTSIIGKDLSLEGISNYLVQPRLNEEITSYEPVKRSIAEFILQSIDNYGARDRDRIVDDTKEQFPEQSEEAINEAISNIMVRYEQLVIKIPRVTVEPKVVKEGRFYPFSLDLTSFTPQPLPRDIIKKSLEDGATRKIQTESHYKSKELHEYIIAKDLLNLNEIPEDQLDIILDLANQMLRHLHTYLSTPEDVENVVYCHKDIIVNQIQAQLLNHYDETEFEYTSTVDSKYIPLPKTTMTLPKGVEPLPYDQTLDNNNDISSYIFSGFQKSQYAYSKFHSNTERSFARVLEQDETVLKWVRPPRNSLHLYYHIDKQYEPDFIVESVDGCYLCEIKSTAEMDDPEVLQKAQAATEWCKAASKHALDNSGKAWKYLLIPHTAVNLTMTLQAFVEKYVFRDAS